VFVRKKDAIELLRHDAALLQTQYQLPRAQSAIDKNLAVIRRDERTVSRAPAAEHGQAEHGF
jgi:Flp pilus assembly protein TadD